jgi:MacB-like protein
MLKNYLKIAFRNLWRKKAFSFISITGLAIGMASCFLIFLYVHFEFSYDQFHSKSNHIYRVVGDLKSPAETMHWYQTPGPMARAMKTDFPEVREAARIVPVSILVRKDNIKFQEEHSLWADSSIFSVFDFPLKYGDPGTALREPNSIVFSETAARKYFGDSNPVGQSLLLSGRSLHKTISRGIFENAVYPLQLLGIALGIGLLAGIYPAIVLSSFKPIEVLKGRFKSGNKGILLRKVLVVVQFAISITLIVGTLVVYSQLDFMRNRSLGFNKPRSL